MASTDPDSGRYALQCVQLCGAKNRMAATDGRHLIVQTGFDFPWDEDLLLPASPLFRQAPRNADSARGPNHAGDRRRTIDRPFAGSARSRAA